MVKRIVGVLAILLILGGFLTCKNPLHKIAMAIQQNPSPSNGSTIIDATPLLDWEDVASAAGYHIQVNTYIGFAGTVIANVDTLTASQYPITAALLDNTTYYWHVKIKNEDGVWGDWSSTWSFYVFDIYGGLSSHGLSMRFLKIIDGENDTWNSMTLTSYALSVTEVTQGDYQAVMGSNQASGYGVGNNYPAYYVTWYDAVKFCNALSSLIGLESVYNESTWESDFTKNGFYLPTEAQWEYAAGGPDHYIWSLSDTFDTWDYACSVSPQDLNGTIEVKSHSANGFGLYDMSGNVLEWCHDWYGSTFPHIGETDPDGPLSGSYRCLRSGEAGATPIRATCAASTGASAVRATATPTSAFVFLPEDMVFGSWFLIFGKNGAPAGGRCVGSLHIVNCKIVTIPFNQQAEIFPTEDLERFMTGKKVKSIKATNFRSNNRVYWSIFMVYEIPGGGDGQKRKREHVDLNEEQQLILNRLKAWRKERADSEGFPLYLIATNRQLVEIVLRRPATPEGLKMIEGIGEKKVEKYGKEILNLIGAENETPGASNHNAVGKGDCLDS